MGLDNTNESLINQPLGGVDSNLDEDGNQRVDLAAGGLNIDLSSLTGFLFVDSGTPYALAAASARDKIGLDTDDDVAFNDITISTPSNIYALSHDSFADFAANEHFLQTAITNVSTALATGLLKVTTGTGALSVITDNSTDWDTAFGWGDHSVAGYAVSGGAEHDGFSDFVADEHVAHTGVTLTAGVGLSGGGDISANRTFTVDLNELAIETTIAAGDYVTMVDITDSGSGKITFANFESALDHNSLTNTHNLTTDINHDLLTNFSANEHIDHSTVSILAGTGLTGGGDLTVNRTLTLDYDDVTISVDSSGVYVIPGGVDHDSLLNTHNLTTDIDHDALTNFVSGEHFLQTAITNVSTGLATGLLKVTNPTGALSVITDSSANWDTAYTHSQDNTQAHSDYLINNGDDSTSGKLTVGSFQSEAQAYFLEQAAAAADVAGYGQLWVKSTTPNEIWFTDDAGMDVQLGRVDSAINHDSLLNFVVNEHIDHSTVSILAGTGLLGGGDLTTNRTLTLDYDGVTINVDSGGAYVVPGGVDHDSLLNVHQAVTIAASPTFVTADLTGITNGNIPYMSASGFADSPLSTDGTDLIVAAGVNFGMSSGPYLTVSDNPNWNRSGEMQLWLRSFNNDSAGSAVRFYHSRNTTIGGHSAVNDGDIVGSFLALGSDGDSFESVGAIRFYVDGAVADSQVPGRVTIHSSSTSAQNVEAVRLDSLQDMQLGGSFGSGDGKLHVNQAATAGAKPVLTLDQNDVSEQFIKFIGESAADNTQSFADAADLTTPGSIVGWFRIEVQDDASLGPITDGDYWVPFYSTPTA